MFTLSATISIERGGRPFVGEYTLDNNMITIRWRGHTMTTQLGGLPPELMARILLQQMVVLDAD
jgi:hypothetical protein